MLNVRTVLTAVTLTALAALPAASVTVLSVTPAFAEKGGNGNGNGRANNNRNNNGNDRARSNGNNRNNGNARANNRNNGGGNNGRGAIARELGGLNAANASPTALANAAPNSMPGKLYSYQQAQLAASAINARVTETGDLYNALQNMTEAQFKELNPSLDYASTLASVGADYQAALNAQAGAETNIRQALAALTGGRQLSRAAMSELHDMLGL